MEALVKTEEVKKAKFLLECNILKQQVKVNHDFEISNKNDQQDCKALFRTDESFINQIIKRSTDIQEHFNGLLDKLFNNFTVLYEKHKTTELLPNLTKLNKQIEDLKTELKQKESFYEQDLAEWRKKMELKRTNLDRLDENINNQRTALEKLKDEELTAEQSLIEYTNQEMQLDRDIENLQENLNIHKLEQQHKEAEDKEKMQKLCELMAEMKEEEQLVDEINYIKKVIEEKTDDITKLGKETELVTDQCLGIDNEIQTEKLLLGEICKQNVSLEKQLLKLKEQMQQILEKQDFRKEFENQKEDLITQLAEYKNLNESLELKILDKEKNICAIEELLSTKLNENLSLEKANDKVKDEIENYHKIFLTAKENLDSLNENFSIQKEDLARQISKIVDDNRIIIEKNQTLLDENEKK